MSVDHRRSAVFGIPWLWWCAFVLGSGALSCGGTGQMSTTTAAPSPSPAQASPEATATPSVATAIPTAPSATATPEVSLPTPAGPDAPDWLTFVAALDKAFANRELAFVVSRLKVTPVECDQSNTPLHTIGGPDCRFVGQRFNGFPVSSGGEGGLANVGIAIEGLSRLIESQLPSESDQYGSGRLHVYAVALYPDGTGLTVATVLITRPPDWGGTGPLRRIATLVWAFDGANWRVTAIGYGSSDIKREFERTTPPFPEGSLLRVYP